MKSTVYALSSRDICLTSSPPPPLRGTQDCNTYKKVLANLSPSNGGLTRLLCESMSAELWAQCKVAHPLPHTVTAHTTHTLFTLKKCRTYTVIFTYFTTFPLRYGDEILTHLPQTIHAEFATFITSLGPLEPFEKAAKPGLAFVK